MRLLEGNKKIHHGTFIDDHTFVDRDGNVYDLQKSSIDDINDLFNNKSNGDSREQEPNDNSDIEDSANETGGEGSQKSGGGESNSQQSNDNQSSDQSDADNNNSDSSNSSDDAPQGADGESGEGQSQGSGNQNDGNQQDDQQGQQGNGNQDSDNDDKGKIPPDPNKEYIDLRTNKHYRWNGSKFIQVGN